MRLVRPRNLSNLVKKKKKHKRKESKPPPFGLIKVNHSSGAVISGLCTLFSLPLLDKAFVFTAV